MVRRFLVAGAAGYPGVRRGRPGAEREHVVVGGRRDVPRPVAAHAGFLLLVPVPLCWRFRAPATVAIVVVVAAAAYVLVMFSAKAQPPIEPWLAMLVSVFALASRVDGRRLLVAA